MAVGWSGAGQTLPCAAGWGLSGWACAGRGRGPICLGGQHGLLDAGEGVEQLAHAHVDPVVVGLADHQAGDDEGEHAVEGVDPGPLVGEVEHRGERDHLGFLHLVKLGLDRLLGAVGHDQSRRGDVAVLVAQEDPSADQPRFEVIWARSLVWRVRRGSAGDSPGSDVEITRRHQRGLEMAGDLGLDPVAGSAGPAPGKRAPSPAS